MLVYTYIHIYDVLYISPHKHTCTKRKTAAESCRITDQNLFYYYYHSRLAFSQDNEWPIRVVNPRLPTQNMRLVRFLKRVVGRTWPSDFCMLWCCKLAGGISKSRCADVDSSLFLILMKEFSETNWKIGFASKCTIAKDARRQDVHISLEFHTESFMFDHRSISKSKGPSALHEIVQQTSSRTYIEF